ncbi:OmpA family protein, partial [Porphyromonas levii]|uniref:OmpA family protein n=1 Tax=Porphyromonas levii TaxID=28114 RepID=UPI001B8D98DB
YGCADCFVHEDAKVLLTPFLGEPYVPQYMLTYITPKVEPVKARADRHTATFNFVVAKHDLKRDYKNNAAEFDRVDKVVSEVVKNKDLTITEFAVTGYASPEGNFEYNRALAGRRANSFADYLMNTYGIKRNQFKVTGHGEDWEGLKEAVNNSSLANKSTILDIIANTPNADARDGKIRALDGSQTYNNLLNNFYPQLRRTEYVIAYNVRAFDVEEAKEIIKTNPKLLSLNEMYLVAKSYPADSKEFKEVFDVASRVFPNEPVAMINASAADIEGGNYQAAIDRLSKLSNHAEALNNLGIAYARKGNLEQAKASFQKAASMGSTNAQHNLNELIKLQESL